MNQQLAHKLFFDMKRIRAIELAIAKRYSEQQMRCPVHLSVGQEGVAAAVGNCLTIDDYGVSGHRAHAHYLCMGGDLKSMIAEIYGKKTGCCKGKGGSMHLIDTRVGFMGSTAIVGGTIPVGVGLAMAAKIRKENRVSCVFLGDGAVEEGVFYESANFAVLHKLPVLFLCENNYFSVYTPLHYRQPEGREIYKMIQGIGLSAEKYNGNDIENVYDVTKKAVDRIRQGSGPQFLEFETWRWLEHCGPNPDDNLNYRDLKMNQYWSERDPVDLYEKSLLKRRLITQQQITEMDAEIDQEIMTAFEFAQASAFPDDSEMFEGVYE